MLRTKYLAVSALLMMAFLTSAAFAGTVQNVSIESFSTQLGQAFSPTLTLDGQTGSGHEWFTRTSDTDPFIIWKFDDGPVKLGNVTLTNGYLTYRLTNTAVLSYRLEDSGPFTEIGEFQFTITPNGITTVDFGGVMAKYVQIDIKTNVDTRPDPDIIRDLEPGLADTDHLTSLAEVSFEIADGIANAGPDQSVHDSDDVGSAEVTFDGSASDYPDGSITSYSWSIDGSEIATGVNPTVRINVGTYEVTLTVETNDGQTDSDTMELEITGTPVTLAFAGDDQIVTDEDDSGSEIVTLDGSDSAPVVVNFQWMLGTTELANGPESIVNVDLPVGVHVITLNVVSTVGTTDSDDVQITVLDGGPQAPIADAGLDISVIDSDDNGTEPIDLDASNSVDPDGTIVSWVWTEGGSQIGTGETPTIDFAVGLHTVTLTVTDDDGETDTDEVIVNVNAYVEVNACAPRIGAYQTDNEFDFITSECMDIVREKKVLFASRSFGLNVADGLSNLRNQNSMYALNYAGGFNVFRDGPTALPVDVFDNANFVQYLASYSPFTTRITELDSFIRDRQYYQFLDVAMVFYHTCDPSVFPTYKTVLESLQNDYPNIRVIFVTSGVSPVSGATGNINSHNFSNLVLNEYDGEFPIYDLESILSTDPNGDPCTFESGGQTYPMMCPEFNINGDNIHPNSSFSETRMGKAMLLTLAKMFCEECTAEPDITAMVFYNNSSFDGYDPAANAADDLAIAMDKAPLLTGETATFANYTSYDKGINGLMVDLTTTGPITAADFEFMVGNDSTPTGWAAAPAPVSVTTRNGEGTEGTDRVTIIFADGAVTNTWLQVKVLATANTGLEEAGDFYFGNAIGETGNSATDAIVDATDEVAARNNPRNFMRPALIDLPLDHNRDGKVDATDEIISRNNVTDFSNDLELIAP